MSLITWIVGTLGVGGAIALAAGFFFAPAATLSLLKNAVSFVVEKARDAAKWARDPERNWWKIGCVSFASFFAVASWYADSQRRQVVFVTERMAVEVGKVQLQAEQNAEAATNNFNALLQCRALLATEVGAKQDTERLNREAVARAEAAAAASAKKLANFRRREKSLDCKTALTVLEEKCAAFSDY